MIHHSSRTHGYPHRPIRNTQNFLPAAERSLNFTVSLSGMIFWTPVSAECLHALTPSQTNIAVSSSFTDVSLLVCLKLSRTR